MPHQIFCVQNQLSEWSYTSGKAYPDPFNDLTLEVLVVGTDGEHWRLPAYWAGEQEWRVRFAPPRPGLYSIETNCSDETNPDLHAQASTLEATPYRGENPLWLHGSPRSAHGGRTLQHADGTPFFWLGDSWWMGLCQRLSWPGEFQQLAADRVAKGFTVIQIVAGLYPDMPAFDPRGANEAGFPWAPDYACINPAYFDMADLRIAWLVRCGLTPCIVGSWGYYLPLMGLPRMQQHWRYLIARWGAYPLVWCLAGEAAMPYYLSIDKPGEVRQQIEGWTTLARYVRRVDPYHRLITIHPTQVGRDQVTDEAVLDLDMLQTGHGGYDSVPDTLRLVTQEYQRAPAMPVLVGEVSYEGLMHGTQAEVQRLTFWAALLSGAAGHTYGANGIWQVNTPAQAYGPSPHGGTWGNTSWEEASQLPGSAQLSLAKRLLERYEWWQFAPHPEWVRPAASPAQVTGLYAAGIPGRLRLIYIYGPVFPWSSTRPRVTDLESDRPYQAFFWDPRSGDRHPIGPAIRDGQGEWAVPLPPTFQDWLLVLERT
jgi:hypothetical protein